MRFALMRFSCSLLVWIFQDTIDWKVGQRHEAAEDEVKKFVQNLIRGKIEDWRGKEGKVRASSQAYTRVRYHAGRVLSRPRPICPHPLVTAFTRGCACLVACIHFHALKHAFLVALNWWSGLRRRACYAVPQRQHEPQQEARRYTQEDGACHGNALREGRFYVLLL